MERVLSILGMFRAYNYIIPYEEIYATQKSFMWGVIMKTPNLTVQTIYEDEELYVAIDRSFFYNYVLKKEQFRKHIQEDRKCLSVEYLLTRETSKQLERNQGERVSLSEFLYELKGIKDVKLLLRSDEKKLAIKFMDALSVVKSLRYFTVIADIKIENFIAQNYIMGINSRRNRKKILKIRKKFKKDPSKLNKFLNDEIHDLTLDFEPKWLHLQWFYADTIKKQVSFAKSVTETIFCSEIKNLHKFLERRYFECFAFDRELIPDLLDFCDSPYCSTTDDMFSDSLDSLRDKKIFVSNGYKIKDKIEKDFEPYPIPVKELHIQLDVVSSIFLNNIVNCFSKIENLYIYCDKQRVDFSHPLVIADTLKSLKSIHLY